MTLTRKYVTRTREELCTQTYEKQEIVACCNRLRYHIDNNNIVDHGDRLDLVIGWFDDVTSQMNYCPWCGTSLDIKDSDEKVTLLEKKRWWNRK